VIKIQKGFRRCVLLRGAFRRFIVGEVRVSQIVRPPVFTSSHPLLGKPNVLRALLLKREG